ncbi:hypothetical protein CLAVI_000902 [Candidatus Clavichlamydia salmonicola]|uniref:hypothetical protein n=1 Tax=Candidatus Clavichlamydia salmonicola TaxID=469812 RepID=UPI001891318F|nr:hypothetical protein [Candidatus Clavichlamydia salmonicola]MBF5051261.1 hypothetical protein [Candidatus Clavichlamydia salmonicola]
MSLSIDPFTVKVVLIEKNNAFIICNEDTQAKNNAEKKIHLKDLVEKIKHAAIKKFSVIHTLYPTPSLVTDPFHPLPSNQDLISLAQQLREWIEENKSILLASYGTSFCEELTKSLTINTHIAIPSSQLTMQETSEQISKGKWPKKRWRNEYTQEDTSAPKKPKISSEASNIIEKSTFLHCPYIVKEIFMLDNDVFTMRPTTIENLEEWINSTHQHIGKIITNNEMLFVNSTADTSALQYETLSTLRKFTLDSLVHFLEQNLSLYNNLSSPDTQRQLYQAHLILSTDLKNAIEELGNAGLPLPLEKGIEKKAPISTTKEVYLVGYQETLNILSKTLDATKIDYINPISTFTDLSSKVESIKKISLPLVKFKPNFITLLKNNHVYYIKIYHTCSTRKYEIIAAMYRHAKKIQHHLDNMFKQTILPRMKYQGQQFNNASLFLALLYHGTTYNHSLLEQYFANTFKKNFKNFTLTQYNSTLLELNVARSNIQNYWNSFNATIPIPKLEYLEHPLSKEMLLLYENLPTHIIARSEKEIKNMKNYH